MGHSGIPALCSSPIPRGFLGAERWVENGLTCDGMRIKELDSLNLVVKSRVVVFWKTSDSLYPS